MRDVDVAFADLEAWLDDREAEQYADAGEADVGPGASDWAEEGGWSEGFGGGDFAESEFGGRVEGLGPPGRTELGSDNGGVFGVDDDCGSPWHGLPDAECADMLNRACGEYWGWMNPHEHAQAWRIQETRGDLERELQELERSAATRGRAGAKQWGGLVSAVQEPSIEEEAEEERGAAGMPQVQVVHRMSGELTMERCCQRSKKKGARKRGEGQESQAEVSQEVKRGRNVRPRGGKKRGNQEQVFISVNSSGRPQLVDNLWKLGLRGSRTLVVMAQEHQTKAAAIGDLQKAAAEAGWKLKASAAAKGARGGDSAGTALAIAKHIGCDGGGVGASGEGSGVAEGRITSAWVQGGVRGGILCLSLYLWTSEGMSGRNKEILNQAGELIKQHRGPWIIGADFNMAPNILQTEAGWWLDKVQGVVMASGQATFRPAQGGHSELDYFVVDANIAHAVERTEVVLSLDVKPHRAVRLIMRPLGANRLGPVLRRPRAFPTSRPIGCARMPAVPYRPGDGRMDGEGGGGAEGLEKDWKNMMNCVEIELCGLCDAYRGGSPDARYMGRAEGARVVLDRGLPQRAAAEKGKLDITTYGYAWTATRARELTWLGKSALREGSQWAAASRRQWVGLIRRFQRPGKLLRSIMAEDAKFAQCIQFLGGSEPCLDFEAMNRWANWLEDKVEERTKIRREACKQAWRAFIEQSRRKGAKELHAFVKRQEVAVGESVVGPHGRAGGPHDIVKEEKKAWTEIWHRFIGSCGAPWRGEDLTGEEALARPTVEELRRVAASFKKGTAQGWDSLAPRAIGWLSTELLEVIIDFFATLERVGTWPAGISKTIVHLIPKASGGRRPIGVLATFVRVWEAMRKPIVWQWRAQIERPYNWAATGRSAEMGVWGQSLKDEVARGKGQQRGAVMYDLAKAYEMVRLELVWEHGRRWRFPKIILRLLLECFAFIRHLMFKGAVAEGVETLSAILAGSAFALDALAALMTSLLDELAVIHPRIDFVLFVDDLSTHAREDTAEEVARVLEAGARDIIETIEGKWGMKISRAGDGMEAEARHKTVAIGSSRRVRERLKKGVGKRGIHVRTRLAHLGIDYGVGALGRGKPGVRGKVKKAREVMPRIRRLGAVGGPHVFKTGVVKAVKYGCTVTGLGDAALQSLRAMAAQAHGKSVGRSTTARLTIHGTDPAIDIVVPAIRAWAEAMFTGRPGPRFMVLAWHGAKDSAGKEGIQQAAVKGAASAFLAAIERVGWLSTAPHLVTALDGTQIDLRATAPRIVRKWAEDDWAAAAASRSSVAVELNDLTGEKGYGVGLDIPVAGAFLLGQCANAKALREEALGSSRCRIGGDLIPWFEPLRMMVKSARRSKEGYGEGLRSAVALAEGGWRTQLHLCAEGKASHPYCCSCGPFETEEAGGRTERESEARECQQEWDMQEALKFIDWGSDAAGEAAAGCRVGTVVHRLIQCARNKTAHGRAAVAKIGKLKEEFKRNPWDPLWWRGVPAMPAALPAPTFQEFVVRPSPEVDLIATGKAYTDGACKGLFRKTKRAGWGVCALNEEGEILWGAYGVCPDSYASALRAELWGLLGILRYALPPLSIGTDNAEVVRGWESGPLYCSNPAKEGADLWGRIWDKVRDVGKAGLSVYKVKAHLGKHAIEQGRISLEDWGGNREADRLAVLGAVTAARLSPNKECDQQLLRAVEFYKWVSQYTVAWADDTRREEVEEEGADGKEQAEAEEEGGQGNTIRLHPNRPHAWWAIKSEGVEEQFRCRRCGRKVTGPCGHGAAEKALRTACKGALPERLKRAWAEGVCAGKESWALTVGWLVGKGGKPTDEEGRLELREWEDSFARLETDSGGRDAGKDGGPGGAAKRLRESGPEGRKEEGARATVPSAPLERDTKGKRGRSPEADHTEDAADVRRWKGRKELIESLRARISRQGQGEHEAGDVGGGVSAAPEGGEIPGQRGLEEVLARRRAGGPRRPAEQWTARQAGALWGGRGVSAAAGLDACKRLVGAPEANREEAEWGRELKGRKRKREEGSFTRPRPGSVKGRKEGEAEDGSKLGEAGPGATGHADVKAAGSISGNMEGRSLAAVGEEDGRGGGAVEQEGGREAGPQEGLIQVGKGHHITRTGGVVWCRRCGGHAEARIGSALLGACRPIQKGEKSGRAYRRNLLIRRRHPITRALLDGRPAEPDYLEGAAREGGEVKRKGKRRRPR